MKIACLQHVAFEGPGSVAEWARARGHEVVLRNVYLGDALPEPERFDALVVMGGPMGVHDEPAYPWLAAEKGCLSRWLAADKPILGVCLGAQLLATALGAGVRPNGTQEIGWFPIQRRPEAERSWLGEVLPGELEVFHWHGDTFAIPEGALAIARSEACENQGFVYAGKVIGLQFHLEMDLPTARVLIEQSGELVQGRWVQSAESMLARPERFERLRPRMFELLDRWVG